MVYIRCPICHEENDRAYCPQVGEYVICDFCGQGFRFREDMEVYGGVAIGEGLRQRMGCIGYLVFIALIAGALMFAIWAVYAVSRAICE